MPATWCFPLSIQIPLYSTASTRRRPRSRRRSCGRPRVHEAWPSLTMQSRETRKLCLHQFSAAETLRGRFLVQVCSHHAVVKLSTTFYSRVSAFHYALDVLSESGLGVSFGLLESTQNRWLTRVLMEGNAHMYLQLAWPALFSRLRCLFDVTAITYPRYHRDSRQFLHLCRAVATQVESNPPNATLALMMSASPASVSQDAVRLEAFSYIRGGMYDSRSKSTRTFSDM